MKIRNRKKWLYAHNWRHGKQGSIRALKGILKRPRKPVSIDDMNAAIKKAASRFPKLRDATKSQRSNWRLVGRSIGIHWPDIDEDITVPTLLKN
jgi:hypothetical protein